MRDTTRKSLKLVLVVIAIGLVWWLRGVRIGNPATFADVLPKTDRSAYGLTQVAQLSDPVFQKRLQDFYDRGTENSFKGREGVAINCRMFVQPADEKGAIVISSGRTEALTMYKELIYDLYNQKYSVYIHDHRGQGRSGRLYAADTQRGHVDNFDYYVDDLRTFVQNYVKPSTHAHVFLLAHSMGGGIATRYLEKYGGQFNAVALVTPMHAPLVPAFGLDLSTPLCSASRTSLVSALLPATNFAINQTDWKENAVNDVTNSAERYKIKHNDASKIGGITHGWFREACRAGAEARANAANVTIPTLILQAGRDTAVSNRAQKEFCDRMNEKTKGRCEGYVFPDALHAIFIEEDTIRTPALTKILDFFAAHA